MLSHHSIYCMGLFIPCQPRSRKTLPEAGFLEVLFLGLPPSAGSSGHCVDTVVGVYRFFADYVSRLSCCPLVYYAVNRYHGWPIISILFLIGSSAFVRVCNNMLMVDQRGIEPLSCPLFHSLHTTMFYCQNIYAAITRLTAVITAAMRPMSLSCSTV